MNKKFRIGLIIIGLSVSQVIGQDILKRFDALIEQGEFSNAQKMMRETLAEQPSLKSIDRLALEFEIERLNRIRKDFRKTKADVIAYIKKYIPEVDDKDLERWEKEKFLEYKIIDGQKWYFNRAAANLFLIDKAAKQIKADYAAKYGKSEKSEYLFIRDAEQIVNAAEMMNTPLVKSKRFKLTFTLTVDADAVPADEIIRVWLPYPREAAPRQVDIVFHYSEPPEHIISDNEAYLHRSIYLEKKARKGKSTVFKSCVEFTSYSQYYTIDPDRIQPYDTNSEFYKKFTSERSSHIVFTPELKKISKTIVGDETNPYLKAKKIFQWIDEYSPWAGAREYSTMRNIPMYVIENKHGDCGMQTLLFITLARMNGIPTHWQSGWWLIPGAVNLHDWCEIYIEPYGWLLVDQDLGIQDSDDKRVKWFCLGGTNAYRWIVNNDFSREFYPVKIHPRSETVDFQRGEVEWRGGNLYFDKWDYHLDVKYIR